MTSRPECCSTEFRKGLWLGQAGSVGSYSRTGFWVHYEDNFGWPCLAYWQLAATWRTQHVTCMVLMSVPSPEPHDGCASRVQIQVQMREPFWNSGGYGLSLVVMAGQCKPPQAVRATCSPLSQQWQKLRSRNSSSQLQPLRASSKERLCRPCFQGCSFSVSGSLLAIRSAPPGDKPHPPRPNSSLRTCCSNVALRHYGYPDL